MSGGSKTTTTEHGTKHAAIQQLARDGFAYARTASPPHWWHADGRQAFVKPLDEGRVIIEYRAPQPLASRIWEHGGTWHYAVTRADGSSAGEGEAGSEAEARALQVAVAAAARMSAARGSRRTKRPKRPKRRTRTIARTR